MGVWTGREALVIGGNDGPVYSPSYDGPTVETPPVRDGAAFNPRTRSWRPIADAPIGIQNSSAVAVGGGVYMALPVDPDRPTVSPTHAPGVSNRSRPLGLAASATEARAGHYLFPHGLVLDTTRNGWILLPALPTGWGFEIGGATVVSMGRNLLAFGGPRFPRGDEGRLANDAWVWSPPPPAE